MTTETVRTVNTVGQAVAKYDRVNFSASLRQSGATSRRAKDTLLVELRSLEKTIETLREKFTFVEGTHNSSLSVTQNTRYDQNLCRHVSDGYTASYTVSFQTEAVDEASEIQDQLTSLETVEVKNPVFKISDLTALHNTAFRDAKTQALKYFEAECETLGRSAQEYEISTWEAHYDRSHNSGPQMAKCRGVTGPQGISGDLAGGGITPSFEVCAGQAEVNASATFGFVRKR